MRDRPCSLALADGLLGRFLGEIREFWGWFSLGLVNVPESGKSGVWAVFIGEFTGFG